MSTIVILTKSVDKVRCTFYMVKLKPVFFATSVIDENVNNYKLSLFIKKYKSYYTETQR